MGAAVKAERGGGGFTSDPGCSGKKSYPSLPAAEKEARLVSAKNTRKKNHAYHCKMCGLFHHGTRIPRAR